MTNPLSDGSEVARCMKEAIKSANLSPEDIDYINAHGTSTPIGDLCEIKAIKTVFANNKKLPKINSTKSIIGHTLGASGGLELVAILMAMETCKLHPTINVEEKEEELGDFDILDRGKINYQVNHAISNSFGFGGHNSVLVVSKK
jgi:3-oxoacyl-[acyl-carrier-protein] synthase II